MESMTAYSYVDGIGPISLADGVVRFDLMSITSIQDGKAIAARSGGLAMSLPAMIKVHDQLGQMINELVQKGVLQRNEQPPKAVGYRAICITVDRAYYSRRERDINNRFLMRESGGDPRYQASLCWDDLAWMRDCTGLPMILKGIASAEDARMAVEHGVECVYVSNHGGRQLDHAQASIEVLPEVVEAVDGRAEVLMDGGIMRGTDVIKALALGASAVGVGKLQGLALAAAGEAGVARMLEIMEFEIKTMLGLMGLNSIKQLNPSWLRAATPVSGTDVMSQYPYFETALRRKALP